MILFHHPRGLSRFSLLAGTTLLLIPFYSAFAESKKTHPTSIKQPSSKVENIVVQGSVIGQATRDAVRHYAGGRSVISRQQLREGAIRSLDDALQRSPSVKIFDETGTGALPQIMMRGLYESRSGRVQVLEDGIPLALAPYGQTSISLFPMTMDMVDHIDIVRGGAAVQYGPNNMGGVINIVSRPIPKKWTTSIGERLQVAGNNGHSLFNEDFSTGGHITERFSAQLDANFQDGHQFRDSNSHTDVHNVRLRTRYDITDDDRILTDYANYAINTGLPGALTPDQYREDRYKATRPLDQVKGSTNRGSLIAQHDFHKWAFLTGGQATITFFADEAKRNYTSGMGRTSATTWDSGLAPQMMQTAPRNFTVYGVQPQVALRTKQWGISHEVSIGARGVFETIDYKVNRRNPIHSPMKVFRDWKFNNKAWSTFISDKMGFFHDNLTITPGFRFEHVDEAYTDRRTHTRTGNGNRDILPGVTLGYSIHKTGYIFFDAQKSMRPPQSTEIVYGNRLRSEKAWNYETGGRWFPTNRTTLGVTFYRIDFQNQINYDSTMVNPLGTAGGYVNLGATRYQGIELTAEWSPKFVPGLTLSGNYSFLDARQKDGAHAGRRVPYTSKHQITGDVRYKRGNTIFDFSGYYFSQSFTDAANTSQESPTGSVGRVPGYVVFNTQITHTFYKNHNGVKLDGSLAIMNMGNEHYYFRGMDTSPWGREPAPGRTFQIASKVTF